jgi:hypothetical protein
LTCTGAGGSANQSVTITVTPLRSVTVSWISPTVNADNSLLTDLAGFRVYYGTSSGNYNSYVQVANSAATSAVVNNLTPGATYHFAVSAYDTSGNESSKSTDISKGL